MSRNLSIIRRALLGGIAAASVILVLILAGCATGVAPQATNGGTTVGNADLSVKMSSSIFLQPVAAAERTIFLEGHNTSSAQGLGFEPRIAADLIAKGYRIVNDPGKATYMLMYNIRYVGRQTQRNTALGALSGGFGGSLIGSMIGRSYYGGSSFTNTVAGGLAGAAVGAIAGHFFSTHRYMMVADIQVEQRQTGASTVSTTQASEGLGNTAVSSGAAVKGWAIYRDRVVAQAKGMRLTFGYAQPALVREVTGAIAGIF